MMPYTIAVSQEYSMRLAPCCVLRLLPRGSCWIVIHSCSIVLSIKGLISHILLLILIKINRYIVKLKSPGLYLIMCIQMSFKLGTLIRLNCKHFYYSKKQSTIPQTVTNIKSYSSLCSYFVTVLLINFQNPCLKC